MWLGFEKVIFLVMCWGYGNSIVSISENILYSVSLVFLVVIIFLNDIESINLEILFVKCLSNLNSILKGFW